MRNMLRKTSVFAILTLITSQAMNAAGPGPAPPPPAPNLARVYGGGMILAQVGNFFGTLYNQGIVTSFPASTNLPDGSIAGPVGGGALDLNTGQGEVQSLGGITFTSSTQVVTLQRLTLDTTPSGAFLSAAVFVGGVYQGRQPVFQITTPTVVSSPIQLGEYIAPAQNFTVNPTFAGQIGSYFSIAPFPSDTPVGSVALDIQLVPIAQ